jgi:serine/threonine-protein kinase RsbT
MSVILQGQEEITCEGDIITTRKVVRDHAKKMGFSVTDITRIVTTTSELTRNIYLYAGSGIMRWREVESISQHGIELVFEDNGPGIPDLDQAMEPGFSSGGGLGLGLPGAKRLMDEMEIKSIVGKGTTVIVRKWLRR